MEKTSKQFSSPEAKGVRRFLEAVEDMELLLLADAMSTKAGAVVCKPQLRRYATTLILIL